MKKLLFVIPFAGGTAGSYSVFRKYLIPSYELVEIDFPGRGKNKSNLKTDNMIELIDNLYEKVIALSEMADEYSIIGHSMGAYLAYEIVSKMQLNNKKLPINLIISGAPVYKVLKEDSFYQKESITKEDVIDLIQNNGWMNDKLLSSKIFKNYIYKNIYEDLNIMRSYKLSKRVIDKSVKISVFYGNKDKYDDEAYLEWNDYFDSKVNIYSFPDGHFFIVNQYKVVTDKLNSILS